MHNSFTFPVHFQSQIDKALDILKPFTKRVYLVGGSVRDLFLGHDLHDLDIEVYDIEPETFERLMLLMGAVGVGKSFFVYKLGNIDFALPRCERKCGVGHRAFEVELATNEKEASKRRDFSVNAMMLNLYNRELLDFWGGVRALKQKKLVVVDERHFGEDSLRVLRAIQFSARLGFKIDLKSLELMREISLDDLSKTRIFWEFEKLFNATKWHYGLFYMYQLLVFEKCFDFKAQERYFTIARELIRCKKNEEEALRPYYFFYIVANLLDKSPLEWLKKLEAPNHYLNTFKFQPYFKEEITDKMLLLVSLDMPIKSWLGNYRKGLRERAIELGIWESVFTGEISVQDVISDGFTKSDIKKELRRRRIEKIEALTH